MRNSDVLGFHVLQINHKNEVNLILVKSYDINLYKHEESRKAHVTNSIKKNLTLTEKKFNTSTTLFVLEKVFMFMVILW